MYAALLADARFHDLLLAVDRDLADACRTEGCACGGRRHMAHYARKPRGRPCRLGPEHDQRFSFCCAVDGCRSRATPPSLRFLGRRVYVATIVVLITILQNGVSDARLERLSQVVSIDRRTIAAERSRSKNNGGSIFRAASLSWPIEACLMSRLLARNAPLGFAASFCAVSAAVASRSRSGHPAPPPAWQ